ncbi:hypothetical protein M9Y10_018795 [Tritrichomonas musculus]|uniref:Right handed beta helix domain-containing protein n=1 Tax=Tritrichomonas musculus TaxID=1915356 RepID=A0ABR2HHW7_9EUKA
MLSILSLIIFSKEIKADCPPKAIANSHDISLGDYSFQEKEYIYGCHVNAKAINAVQCNLLIYACKFVSLNSQTEKGGAIYLSITDYFQAAIGENKIQNCDFIDCSVTSINGAGGALYISSTHSYSIFTIEYCNFEYNSIYYTLYKQNSIYFAASNGNIRYCQFQIQKALIENHGSAIHFSFGIDGVTNTQKVNVEHNNFTQNNCFRIYSLIEFDFQKTAHLNFNSNTININGNNEKNFRLFRANVETTDSISSFKDNCLSVTNSESNFDIFQGFQIAKEDFVEKCTTQIPDRPEEPGELPEESGPIVLLDSSNCNKEKRCSRSPKESEQIHVIVLVTDFTGYKQTDDDGGAIKITNCGLTCNISSFTDCSSQNGVGGAIYFDNRLQHENNLEVKDIVFTHCSAKCGGGIYIVSLSDLSSVNVCHCKFISNSATATETEEDQLKFGGTCVFMYCENGEVTRCSFKNSIGVGGSVKVYIQTATKSEKVLRSDLNTISIDHCNFLNDQKSGSSLYYFGGNSETNVNVHNCVFKGKLNDKSRYIEGVLRAENAAKIAVKSCNFDYKLKDSVDVNLVKIDQEKDHSGEIWWLISSVALLAVVAVSIFAFIAAKLKREKSSENSLELQDPLNEDAK